jgi:sulfate adenylyltransferase subunit 2
MSLSADAADHASDAASERPIRLLAHLQKLEDESIHIFREVVAECRAPVMLYSIGKDSAVLLHLALKAFHPARLPFPVLHIDTGWKFREMIAHRDATAARYGLDLIVHTNQAARDQGINPFDHGSFYTQSMKTVALKQALDAGQFDAAFGGARRDEEKSRAKERVFSFRTADHGWDPKNQRPEFWRLTNSRLNPGESIRVFPLSNWTELDIWQYIQQERIDVVPLYFAQDLPVVVRDGALIVVHDDRMRLLPNEQPAIKRVRFRSLGCYPLTSAVSSDATDIAGIVAEVRAARQSERGGRLIDRDEKDSMEHKKREGYF